MRLVGFIGDARSWVSGVSALVRFGDICGALNLAGRTIIRSRRPVRVRLGSLPVFVRPCTPDLAIARICLGGEFHAAIAAARPLQYNFIVDAGGYIGTAAMVLAKAFPDATIVSLEPSSENYAVLAMNTASCSNVVALNVALGASEGAARLVDRGTGEVGFSTVQAPADCASPSQLEQVQVTTVSDLMRRFQVLGIDILKLDVEGSEHDLLQGNPGWIDVTRVILAELHDRIVPGCEAVFAGATAGRDNFVCDRSEKKLSVKRI